MTPSLPLLFSFKKQLIPLFIVLMHVFFFKELSLCYSVDARLFHSCSCLFEGSVETWVLSRPSPMGKQTRATESRWRKPLPFQMTLIPFSRPLFPWTAGRTSFSLSINPMISVPALEIPSAWPCGIPAIIGLTEMSCCLGEMEACPMGGSDNNHHCHSLLASVLLCKWTPGVRLLFHRWMVPVIPHPPTPGFCNDLEASHVSQYGDM